MEAFLPPREWELLNGLSLLFLFPGKYLSARKVSLLKRLFSPHWGIGNFKILIYYEMDSQLSKTFPSSVCILGIEPSFW